MRFVVQRVSQAGVVIAGAPPMEIGRGLLILMGIHRDDTVAVCGRFVERLLNLRVFPDEALPINASLRDVDGEALIVSQFTLYGDCRGQNRPSFMEAARPEAARPVYEAFVEKFRAVWPKTKTGEFAAAMQVSLVNDGPVTVIVE